MKMEVEAKLTLRALGACRHDAHSVGCSPKRDALEALVHTWAVRASAMSFWGRRLLERSELEPRIRLPELASSSSPSSHKWVNLPLIWA